jgi:hypothetical protein
MTTSVNTNTTATGATNVTVATTTIGGAEFQSVLQADPATGSAFKGAADATLATANTNLVQIHNDLIAALPAGTNLIGKVGIDQTTPGTTNAVSVGSSISSLPLPTGAATAANQAASANGSALETGGNLATVATKTTSIAAQLPAALGGNTVPASLAVTAPRKLNITGFASVALSTTYANLLDPSAGSAATDVRDYNTVLLTVVSTATTGSYTIQGSFDSARTIGLVTLQAQEITVQTGGAVINGAITPTAATRVFRVNVADINYLSLNLSTGITANAIQAYATLTQAVTFPTQLTVVQGTGSSLNVQTTGAAAQGATASGNPVFTAGIGKTAQPTARTDGQIVAPLFDKIGRMVTVNNHVRDLTDLNSMVTLTSTTETTIIAAIASTFNDIVSMILTNTSATGVRVDLRTVAAGTVVASIWLPATTTLTVDVSSSLKQATVNTAWTAQLSAAVTDVRITAVSIRSI